jgi:hypothetical protein
MAEKGANTKDEEILSLGVAALIGKAMNDQNILNALSGASGNKERLYEEAKKACVELTDCDLEALVKPVVGKFTIIDLIRIAKKCLKDDVPDVEDKWRD